MNTKHVLLALILVWIPIGCAEPTAEVNPGEGTSGHPYPNILLIIADDMGFSDLGVFGGEISTPALDQLAASGIRFSNFHVGATCSPTRSMLLTGVDNHRAGLGNMFEFLTDNQKGQPGYEGYLNDRVVTLATLLRDAGYRTAMTGKWHLGTAPLSYPSHRGFEKTFVLLEGAANNFKKEKIARMYAAHWMENGQEVDLPIDFFSSDYYTTRIIEYIDEAQADGKPFFAYLSFQALHWPYQVPQTYVEKYADTYAVGWDEIRRRRFERQKAFGLLPANLDLPPRFPTVPSWNSLSEKQQRYEARVMAVYAGMADNMDDNIGRVLRHLEQIGVRDNTVVIFLSDNGADYSEPELVDPEWYGEHFDTSIDNLGNSNSFPSYGQRWANVANTPYSVFKTTSAEGGLRVPLLISYPGRIEPGRTTDAFAYVKDVAATILDLAGVQHPGTRYQQREVFPMTGRSMAELLTGSSDQVHDPDEAIGYELMGHSALFRGRYKITRLGSPFGDRTWRLYDVAADPGEMKDLSSLKPVLFREMVGLYEAYGQTNGVIPVPDDFDPLKMVKEMLK